MTVANRPRFLLLSALLLAVPATGRAEHRPVDPVLLDAALCARTAVQRYHAVACELGPTAHDAHLAELACRFACRLVEGIEQGAPWGRIKADFVVLRNHLRHIETRLDTACRFPGLHPTLAAAWRDVRRPMQQLQILIEGPGGCGTPVAGFPLRLEWRIPAHGHRDGGRYNPHRDFRHLGPPQRGAAYNPYRDFRHLGPPSHHHAGRSR